MARYHERLVWWLNSLGVTLLVLSVLLVPATLSNADSGGDSNNYYYLSVCSGDPCDNGCLSLGVMQCDCTNKPCNGTGNPGCADSSGCKCKRVKYDEEHCHCSGGNCP